MVKLVGIAGKAGAGKDHFGKLLMRRAALEHGLAIARVPFADGVRRDIEEQLGVDEAPRLWAKPTPPTIRRLLQWWGTDLRRAENDDYWVEYALEAVARLPGGWDAAMFTDVRFRNEAEAILDRDGRVVMVKASAPTRQRRIGTVPDHASERLDVPHSLIVWNDHDGIDPGIPPGLWDYLLER